MPRSSATCAIARVTLSGQTHTAFEQQHDSEESPPQDSVLDRTPRETRSRLSRALERSTRSARSARSARLVARPPPVYNRRESFRGIATHYREEDGAVACHYA